MKLLINGEIVEFSENSSFFEVINSLKNKSDHFAIAVNKCFIPKSQYEKIKLKENDQIEVVTPHPGG